jgi:hypothetical protein
MAETITATDQEMVDQVKGIHALTRQFASDWQPQRITNWAAGSQGLPIGDYHVLLPGNNSGDGMNTDFNAAAVQSAFVDLAGSVSKKLSSTNEQLAQVMQGIIEAGKLLDNAALAAQITAENF